jgi:hypothetical protein
MRVAGPRRATAALFAAFVAALVSAAPNDAYEDRHQPLAALDPSTFVDGTSSPTRFSGEISSEKASSADERAAPFAISVRASAPRASGELECEDTVVVTVTARVAPSETHWVASYSPPRANVTATAPTKYALLTRDPAYRETGVSSLSFRLTCARHAYDFVVFTDDWVVRQSWRQDLVPSAVAVARSEPVVLKDAAGPRAPRLVALAPSFEDDVSKTTVFFSKTTFSFTGGDAEELAEELARSASPLAVAWSSGRGAEARPRLRWWVARDGDETSSRENRDESDSRDSRDERKQKVRVVRVRRATTQTYARSDLCGAPANGTGFRDPGFVHVARFGDALRPGTRVEYELTDDFGATYPAATRPRLAFTTPRVLETDHPAFLREEKEKETPDDDPSVSSHHRSAFHARGAFFGFENVSDTGRARASASRSTTRPFSLALFGDAGRGTDDDATTWQEYGSAAIGVSRALTTAAEDGHVDAAFLFGDLSYAVGYGSVWDEFCEQITPFASRVPLLTSLGNHDFDGTAAQWAWMRGRDVRSARSSGGDELDASATRSPRDRYGRGDSGGECGVPSSVRFPTPGRFEKTGTGFEKNAAPGGGWFAVTLGPFRVVSMNTEVSFEKGSAQYAFLESALSDQKLDRSKTPFVVAVAHRPVLVDSFYGRDGPAIVADDDDARDASDVGVALALQKHVWPLFVARGVDVYVAGHNHAYQRHCAFAGMYANGTEPNGPNRSTYFGASGCASFSSGAPEHRYDDPRAPVSLVVGTAGAGFTRHDLGAEFVETTQYAFGYLRLTAESATTMRGAFVRADGGVSDAFAIVKASGGGGGSRSRATEPSRAPRRAGGGGRDGVDECARDDTSSKTRRCDTNTRSVYMVLSHQSSSSSSFAKNIRHSYYESITRRFRAPRANRPSIVSRARVSRARAAFCLRSVPRRGPRTAPWRGTATP